LAHQYGDEDWLPSDPESMGKIAMAIGAAEITESFAVARRYFLTNW